MTKAGNFIQVKVVGNAIITGTLISKSVLVLKETEGDRHMLISVGAVGRSVHEMFNDVLKLSNMSVARVLISKLKNRFTPSEVHIIFKKEEDEIKKVYKMGDVILVTLPFRVPIFVAEDIMSEHGRVSRTDPLEGFDIPSGLASHITGHGTA